MGTSYQFNQVSERRVTELASELIRLSTEKETGMFISEFLHHIGIHSERQPCGEGRFNVIGQISGKTPNNDFYIGHMDTVPAGNEAAWTYPPFCPNVKDRKLFGRGAADMKGGLAAMLHAAELLAQMPKPENGLIMLFDADEECHNLGIKRFLQDPPQGNFAIIGEPSSLTLALGHRGVMAFEVSFSGRSSHAARPELGINAITTAIQFCNKVNELSEFLSSSHSSVLGPGLLTTTMIRGGTQVNMIPESCKGS